MSNFKRKVPILILFITFADVDRIEAPVAGQRAGRKDIRKAFIRADS